ncbi:hypothetical protein EDB80DRAFT_880727 [Ilyonectria destructans]|nr:hypothetical protein EDB80DRAFT_880727 [Ilyonectria destructans]
MSPQFPGYEDLCEGWTFNATHKWPDTTTRLNNTYVTCQLIQGVPTRVDGGPANIFDDGSKWSTPVYSCASAVKATIKTVHFFHNGTSDNLQGLVIKDLQEKRYKDESEMPLWGIEVSSFTLEQFEPIWGLVDPAFEDFQNISTIRAPSLYLPQLASQTLAPTLPVTNLPGAILPVAAYKTIRLNAGSIWTGIDYTAGGSMSLWMRWKELSKSATTMPKIVQFLWTDIAASALVGSKGVLGSRNMEPDQAATINIHPTVHRVKYHWPFAIPAFIVVLLIGLVFVVVVLSVVFGNASLGGMNKISSRFQSDAY